MQVCARAAMSQQIQGQALGYGMSCLCNRKDRLWVLNENLSKMHNDECKTESMCLLAETQIITLAAEKL